MFHANTQWLIDYWTARTRPGRAPPRAAVDPGELRALISQVFILGRPSEGCYPLRLAGGFVAGLHQRELCGVAGLSLWSERDRLRLRAALEEARRLPAPLVVMAEALTDGPSLSLEVLFAPLSSAPGGVERYLGFYQPLAMVARLQGRPALELSVRALHRPAAAKEAARPVRLAALHGQRIA